MKQMKLESMSEYILEVVKSDGTKGKEVKLYTTADNANARLEGAYHGLPQFCDITAIAGVRLYKGEQLIAELEY